MEKNLEGIQSENFKDQDVRRKYDIFEEFPNGSLIWRDSVPRRYDAERKIQELAESSCNHFYAVDTHDEEIVRIKA